MRMLWGAVSGMLAGAASMIPGVCVGSGEAISSYGSLRRAFPRWLPFLAGASAGMLLLAWLMNRLLARYPMAALFLVIGVMIGGLPHLCARAAAHGAKRSFLLSMAAGFLFSHCAAGLAGYIYTTPAGTQSAPVATAVLILAGFFCACLVAAPEGNGGLGLLLLGAYAPAVSAVFTPDLRIALPVLAGAAAGIYLSARAARLADFVPLSRFAVLGVSLGALFPLYDRAEFRMNLRGAFSIGAMLSGIVLALVFAMLQKALGAKLRDRQRIPCAARPVSEG